MKLSYRELLAKSFEVTWKYKFLWALGIFAGLFNSIEIFRFLDQTQARENLIRIWTYLSINLAPSTFADLYQQSIWAVILYVLMLLAFAAIGIFFLWLAVSAQAAIIKQATAPARNNSFGKSLHIDKSTFWNVFTLNLGSKFIIIVLGVAVTIPQLASYWIQSQYAQTIARSTTIGLLILFLLLAIFIYFSVLYAINYVVIEKRSAKDAIHEGVVLFTKNLTISIETGLLLLFITLVLSNISVVIINILFIFLGVLFGLASSVFGLVIGSLLFLIVLGITLAFIGAVTVFQITLWALLFQKLTQKEYKGFLHRLFRKA